jgi:hypothetical protein
MDVAIYMQHDLVNPAYMGEFRAKTGKPKMTRENAAHEAMKRFTELSIDAEDIKGDCDSPLVYAIVDNDEIYEAFSYVHVCDKHGVMPFPVVNFIGFGGICMVDMLVPAE